MKTKAFLIKAILLFISFNTIAQHGGNNLYGQNNNIEKKQNLDKLISVNALKLNAKTIIIKGYNENADIDEALLKTIDLESKNIESVATTSGYGTDLVPVTINLDLNDEIRELIDDDNEISEYEVVSGDTLSSIADKFKISVETILWANDLSSKSSIKIGQKLVILPVSGISYKVKKGDTVSSLAKKFNIAEKNIVDFNKTEGNMLVIGETIVIPGGKLTVSTTKPTPSGGKTTVTVSGMVKPIIGGIKTQGLHGHNGIDFGAPIGSTVVAALDGVVTLTRGGDGWNGGYGNYIVIKHSNGTQTLYAHLSNISVNQGQTVNKGQMIGRSGNSGQSTGPHLHFEVRGARNPF